jgi:hypothetical protein
LKSSAMKEQRHVNLSTSHTPLSTRSQEREGMPVQGTLSMHKTYKKNVSVRLTEAVFTSLSNSPWWKNRGLDSCGKRTDVSEEHTDLAVRRATILLAPFHCGSAILLYTNVYHIIHKSTFFNILRYSTAFAVER